VENAAMTYIFNLLIALDILCSAILAGQPGETMSGRAGSALLEGKTRGKILAPAIDVLMHLVGQFPTWRGHCVAAIEGDKARAKAVIAQRV
jgi:hypothetical protein